MSFLSNVLGTHNDYRAGKHTGMSPGDMATGVSPLPRANLGNPVNTFGQANVGRGAGLDLSNYGNTINSVQGQVAGRGGPAQDTIARQGMLADQLQAASQGQGPNPALEQLRQTTAANANAAAGAAASARGINPALAARMGVDAAASANQQAAGQAATLAAQQQIAARDQMAGVLASRGNAQLGQQTAGAQALGTAGGLQNAQNTGQIANTLGAQDLQLRDALGTNALNLQGSLGQQGLNLGNALGFGRLNLDQSLGQQGLNLANYQGAEKLNLGADAINAGVASGNQQQSGQIVGGLLGGAGAGISALSDERAKADVHRLSTEAMPGVPEAKFRYKGEPAGTQHRGVIAQDVEKVRPDLVGRAGGMRTVPAGLMKYAGGGEVPYGGPLAAPADEDAYAGPMARPASDATQSQDPLGNYLDSLHNVRTDAVAPAAVAGAGGGAGAAIGAGVSALGSNMQKGGSGGDQIGHYMGLAHSGLYANGGRVPAMVSPQEVVVPPSAAHSPKAAAAMVASGAGKVPGKGKVSGDSPKNDTVKASLSPGSVVIPRSITQGENAPERAASFVASVMRRSGGQKLHSGGYLAEKAGPGPSSHADYSEGGYVEADPGAKQPKSKTARGAGRDETRRRIKSAPAPVKMSEED